MDTKIYSPNYRIVVMRGGRGARREVFGPVSEVGRRRGLTRAGRVARGGEEDVCDCACVCAAV